MNWEDITTVLNSLPSTYRRNGGNYAAFQNSLVAGISRFTLGIDSIAGQASFATPPVGKWLDAWGRLFAVPRNNGESDAAYYMRVKETLVAWRATIPGMEDYMQFALGITAMVEENFPQVGWSLIISSLLTAAQLAALITNLAFIRPAGVPFKVFGRRGGLYLSTVNFLHGTRVTGSWLIPGAIFLPLTIPSSTNNAVPTLPTTWLTDPTINPSLAVT
jgi:hypothetical protein